MKLVSWLPEGGENVFQAIKEQREQAEELGIPILNLSVGQPTGSALPSARIAAAIAVARDDRKIHEYQDNGSPGVPNFAQRFVAAHVTISDKASVAYLPIPGIKPMLGLVPLACRMTERGTRGVVGVMNDPGYATPGDWCDFLRVKKYSLSLDVANEFRFSPEIIWSDTKLLMVNYPNNPSGQVATREWWMALCKYCAEHGIRLFNDAAYAGLAHYADASTLAEVAVGFPELSWVEAFSASKLLGNATGWRVGAMVGSPDFIGDIATIKGNTDSGFVAPMAAGVIAAVEEDSKGIEANREMYRRRINLLVSLLKRYGMELAVMPRAGFFTLWKVPSQAFGESVEDAEHFNAMMIEKTGVIGVPFGRFMRYAVCGDVEAMEGGLNEAFEKARVSYR